MKEIKVNVGVICERDGKILMVKEFRDEEGFTFNQPVGGLEKNESLEDGAIREFEEETGYVIKLTSFLGVYTWQINENITSIRICFIGEIKEGRLKEKHIDEDQTIIKPLWILKDDLIEEKLKFRNPVTIKCLNDYFNGQFYPLEASKYLITNEF